NSRRALRAILSNSTGSIPPSTSRPRRHAPPRRRARPAAGSPAPAGRRPTRTTSAPPAPGAPPARRAARAVPAAAGPPPRAIDAVDWLAKTSGGSATVLPREAERRAAVIVPPGPRLVDRIDIEPQYWALVEALLGHVLLAADLDEALKLWRGADHPVTVVTPRGEAIDPLGAVTGGSEPPLEETLLARARELRELEGAHAASLARLAAEERALAER